MKLSEIDELEKASADYRVTMELRENGILRSDMCPARDEDPLPTLDDARRLAERIAHVVPNAVNIYPIYAHNFCPVEGYREVMLNEHPPKDPVPDFPTIDTAKEDHHPAPSVRDSLGVRAP